MCSAFGCDKKVLAHGLCSTHYYRMTKKGCLDTPLMRQPIENRFFAKVEKAGDGECWKWKGAKTNQGYGKFRYPNGQLAHRFSYEFHNGPITEKYDHNSKNKFVVMHVCDNPECTNPEHLVLGTPYDNAMDMCIKGRLKPQGKGGKRKISRETAISIYKMQGRHSEIAKAHKCSLHIVRDIKCRRRWKKELQELFGDSDADLNI